MTMMIQRVNANSPAQAVKSRARGPTITQLRAKQAALVAAAGSQLRVTPINKELNSCGQMPNSKNK